MNKRLKIMLSLVISLLFVLTVSLDLTRSNNELSGKTFDAVVRSSPNSSPDEYHSVMTLEFLDGKNVETSYPYEDEVTYKLENNNIIFLFENEGEYLEVTFELTEIDEDTSDYFVEISGVDHVMVDNNKVSNLKPLRDTFFNYKNVRLIEK